MPVLSAILYKVPLRSVYGPVSVEVKDVQLDSRKVSAGSAFVAVKGALSDGHDFIDKAVQSGAAAIVCNRLPSERKEGVTWIQVDDPAEAVAYMAHEFYGRPSEQIKLTGVTGTNGKTTIATVLYKLFTSLGYSCGLVSTVRNLIKDREIPATHTTPDAVSLNQLLRMMADEGCTHVFMECSSHAIHQHRITGLRFVGGIFSNITHDHLDYHKTFDEYIRVKKKFFDDLPSSAFAISNLDDKRGQVMLQNTAAKKYYYSIRSLADFKGRIMENSLTGLFMQVNEREVHFRLIGEFNAYNLLAIYGAAVCLGETPEETLRVLSGIDGAEGRFDHIAGPDRIIGIVDYAHTPDALDNVLKTIRDLRKGAGRIITVVGCGGDRDKTKRPVMAKAAAELSDQVILTSDNPRSEDPGTIISEMAAGLNSAAKRKSLQIVDRREAIEAAVDMARAEDIILVAGKGHEKYQDIKGVKSPFDDKEILKELLAKKTKNS